MSTIQHIAAEVIAKQMPIVGWFHRVPVTAFYSPSGWSYLGRYSYVVLPQPVQR